MAKPHVVVVGAGAFGGRIGDGFKFGPALVQWISEMVLCKREIEPTFSLSRF